jgi:DNA-binding protein Fis
MTQKSAKETLRKEIVEEAKQGLARYYMEYPERLDGERSKDAYDWSLRGVIRILALLDKYDIRSAREAKTSVIDDAEVEAKA